MSKYLRSINYYLLLFFAFSFLIPVHSESRVELKTGISLSDYQPEFSKRYYDDDLIAGGSTGLGFGAVNKQYSQKYIPSVLNPIDFKFYYSKDSFRMLAGFESLGIEGFGVSELQSSFSYSAVGFFKGDGNVRSKTNNTNIRLSAGKSFDKLIISALIMERTFRSDYEKNITLYSPGFLGLVHAESNYATSSFFAGISITKIFEKGKFTAEIAYRPKNAGSISSSGKVEQTGAIRFPIDILTGNVSSDLLVANYLYGEKKPNINGMRILTEYQYPFFSNFSISIALDYDRLYVSYDNYLPTASFRFANNSGISRPEIAYAEMLSSYIIYKEPILNEIKSLRLGVVLNF